MGGVLVLTLPLLFGCHSKVRYVENRLPLPPSADTGVVGGQFIQADYGFGFPFPAKWIYLKLSADQEVDEVARFCDSTKTLVVRLSVQLLGPDEKYSPESFRTEAEDGFKARQLTVLKGPRSTDWKTPEGSSWTAYSYRVLDPGKKEWQEEEWCMNREDMLLSVHTTLPKQDADSEKGKKFLKEMAGALAQIRWYTPIGVRGISNERYELQFFNEGFRQALESRSLAKTLSYFDEMYPQRAQWTAFYQQLVSSPDPKSLELKAELSGLVINGDYATASFTITRSGKGDSRPKKIERAFSLSRKEGHWEILAPLGN
jgi:hypothetical protein